MLNHVIEAVASQLLETRHEIKKIPIQSAVYRAKHPQWSRLEIKTNESFLVSSQLRIP